MFRAKWFFIALIFIVTAGIVAGRSAAQSDDMAAGLAAFDRVVMVLQAPRCLNCHPRSDRPRQSDDRHIHLMNVQRGGDGRGAAAMRCSTCHQQHNNDAAGIPGAPNWHLAPRPMGWQGLSKGALCRTLLDRRKNGGRSVDDLIKHMTTDKLVLWAWSPGPGRALPPLAADEFKSALEAWAQAGAPCPALGDHT